MTEPVPQNSASLSGLSIRSALGIAFGAIFALALLLSLISWLLYDELAEDFDHLTSHLPAVVLSRNLVMLNNSLEAATVKLPVAETADELARLGDFARLAAQRLGESLESARGIVSEEKLRVMQQVHLQSERLLAPLQLAAQQRLELRARQLREQEQFHLAGLRFEGQLVRVATGPDAEGVFGLFGLIREAEWQLKQLTGLRAQTQVELLQGAFRQIVQQLEQRNRQFASDEIRQQADGYFRQLLELVGGEHSQFQLQAEILEAEASMAALLSSSVQLGAQFRLLTTGMVSQSEAMVEEARREALEDIRQRKGIMVAVVLSGLALTILLGWYFGQRRMTRPLEGLSRSVEALEQGDLSVQAPLQGVLEIQLLAASFNRMAQSIAHRDHELRSLQLLLRNVIDSLSPALLVVDAQCRLLLWNERAEQICPATAVNLPLSQAIGWLPLPPGQICSAVKGRKPLTLKGLSVDREGLRRTYEISCYPLLDELRPGAVLRLEEVTERVRIEKMIAQSEKMLSIGGLAAGIAHEINNPLAGIMQSLQVLQNRLKPDMPRNRELAEQLGVSIAAVNDYLRERGILTLLEGVRGSAAQAALIVRNMLAFSRKIPEAGRAEFERHDLVGLLENTLDLLSSDYDLGHGYDFRRIQIERQYDLQLPKLPCEGALIQQVVFNLMKNSAQAMCTADAAVVTPCIRVALAREGEMLRLEIADNGPGMPPEVRQRVFEPFFTTKEVGKGTGLGLSVSYFIITEYHRGTIEVESEPGAGTRFIVRLPLEDVA